VLWSLRRDVRQDSTCLWVGTLLNPINAKSRRDSTDTLLLPFAQLVCMVGIIRPICNTYRSRRAEGQAFAKHLCHRWMLLGILGILCGWLNLSIASRDDGGSGSVRGSYWSHTPIKQSPSWVGIDPSLHRALALKVHLDRHNAILLTHYSCHARCLSVP
jgi:hypothetical protein